MTHQLNGRWYLIYRDENIGDYLKAIGTPVELISKWIPVLSLYGETGHTKEYRIDMENRTVVNLTFDRGNLIRELRTPMDTETQTPSHNGGTSTVVYSPDGLTRMIRREKGDNYSVTIVGEVEDDICTLTCTAGEIVFHMKFKKFQS